MSAKINLTLDQGSTFFAEITVLDENDNLVDFTSYTVNSQMRKSYTSANAYTFSVTGSNAGLITMSMNAATTNTVPFGRYVYDVEVSVGTIRSRLIEGIIVVNPRVSR
jgi:hypothetical protein